LRRTATVRWNLWLDRGAAGFFTRSMLLADMAEYAK